MSAWDYNAKLIKDNCEKVGIDFKHRYYICPVCGAPIQDEEWTEDELSNFICPECFLIESDISTAEEEHSWPKWIITDRWGEPFNTTYTSYESAYNEAKQMLLESPGMASGIYRIVEEKCDLFYKDGVWGNDKDYQNFIANQMGDAPEEEDASWFYETNGVDVRSYL